MHPLDVSGNSPAQRTIAFDRIMFLISFRHFHRGTGLTARQPDNTPKLDSYLLLANPNIPLRLGCSYVFLQEDARRRSNLSRAGVFQNSAPLADKLPVFVAIQQEKDQSKDP